MERCNCNKVTEYWGPKNRLTCMNTSDFDICILQHENETKDEYLARIGYYDVCP